MRHYQKCGVLFSYVEDCNPEQIENYELAKADDFKGWHCHHRLETHTADGKKRSLSYKTRAGIFGRHEKTTACPSGN